MMESATSLLMLTSLWSSDTDTSAKGVFLCMTVKQYMVWLPLLFYYFYHYSSRRQDTQQVLRKDTVKHVLGWKPAGLRCWLLGLTSRLTWFCMRQKKMMSTVEAFAAAGLRDRTKFIIGGAPVSVGGAVKSEDESGPASLWKIRGCLLDNYYIFSNFNSEKIGKYFDIANEKHKISIDFINNRQKIINKYKIYSTII